MHTDVEECNKCSQGIGAGVENQIHNKLMVITEELCEPEHHRPSSVIFFMAEII